MALSRAQKKFLAIQRARKRLEQRLETIDWELDELLPDLEKIKELEQTESLEIEVGDEGKDQ